MEEKQLYRGVPINSFTETQAFAASKSLIESGIPGNHIVTLTIGMYLEARRNPTFRKVLQEASLVIPESIGLKLYSLMFPPSFGRILSGRYLANDLMDYCVETDRKVVLFGSTPDNRNLARDVVSARNKGAKIEVITGEYDFSSPIDSAYIAQAIDTMSPTFAVMAGTEVEAEQWINQRLIKPGIKVGVVGNFGQALDCEANQKWYPPRVATHMGIGWLFRLPTMAPPRRKRYLQVLTDLATLGLTEFVHQSKHPIA